MVETFEEIDARRAAGEISWARVCKASGVSYSTVHRLQLGGGDAASVGTVKRLADGLDTILKAESEVKLWLNVQGRKRRRRAVAAQTS